MRLVRHLAQALPALWSADTTANPERKRLLRTLITDVTLDSTQEKGITHITICWQTGGVTQLTATRPQAGHPSNPALLQRVRNLRHKYKILIEPAAAGLLSAQEAALRLGVSVTVLLE